MNKISSESIIIITGAAGFIGSAVVKYLNTLGYTKLLLVDDIKLTEKWKNLLGKKFTDFISKDYLFSWLEDHTSEVCAIIHLGACSNTLEKDGNYLMENNFRYTQKLARFAVEKGIRFIYASSAATYGDGSRGFSDDPAALFELVPLNLYGFSKHLFDLWSRQTGIDKHIVGLKYFNVFGPNENHKGHMSSMVYKMFPKVQTQGYVELFRSTDPRYGDGEQCRDFIYVKDVAKLTCDFLFNDINGLFNMGRGEATTWNRLASALFRAAGRDLKISYITMPSDLARQYQNFTCAEMGRYLNACNYSSSNAPFGFTLEEAVTDYVTHYLAKDLKW